MPAPAAIARLTAALVLAESAVHEARYTAVGAAGPHVHGAHLAALAGPVIGMLSSVLLAQVLLRASVAPQQTDPRTIRLRILWPLATLAVLALFVSQEAVEAALSHHHQGLVDTLAGGWAALPASVVAGALLAMAVRVTSVVAGAPRPGSSLLRWLRLSPMPSIATVAAGIHEVPSSRPPDRLRSGRAPPTTATPLSLAAPI